MRPLDQGRGDVHGFQRGQEVVVDPTQLALVRKPPGLSLKVRSGPARVGGIGMQPPIELDRIDAGHVGDGRPIQLVTQSRGAGQRAVDVEDREVQNVPVNPMLTASTRPFTSPCRLPAPVSVRSIEVRSMNRWK